MVRTLIFDGQVFQTPAWHRGMGKYSIELLKGIKIFDNNGKYWKSKKIILSKNLKTDSLAINSIKKNLPNFDIEYLDLLPNTYDNVVTASKNRVSIDAYVNGFGTKKTSIDFIILSLMQSEIAPVFPSAISVKKTLLVYDLIPLMFSEFYLTDPIVKSTYLTKLSEFFRADKYLTISKTVANDLSSTLGVSPGRIFNINGGPIKHSYKKNEINVPKPYVLMPTGNDLRKNNLRAIQAFEKFNKINDNKYSLVVTSVFNKDEVDELKKVSAKVHFTGNVTGEELNYLYQETVALLFPSEYEGLGLPILEAVEASKPVICSSISAFLEISEDAFVYFDPSNTEAIAKALGCISKDDLVDSKKYANILSRYTWAKSTKLLIDAVETPTKAKLGKKPKIAIFATDPELSNLGSLVQKSYAELSASYEIDLYFDTPEHISGDGSVTTNYLRFITKTKKIVNCANFSASNYDAIIYYLEEESSKTLLFALAHPGILFLHTTNPKKIWQNAINENIVDINRFELERKIDSLIGNIYVPMTTTLVSRQHYVAIKDGKDLKQLVELLNYTKVKIAEVDWPGKIYVFPELVDYKQQNDDTYSDYADKVGKMVSTIGDNL